MDPDDETEMYGAGEGQDFREFSGLSLVGDAAALASDAGPVSVDRATVDQPIGLIDSMTIAG